MNTPLFAALGAALLTTNGWAFDFTDEAQVIVATPIYSTVNEPTQECWNESEPVTSQTAPPHSYAGAVVGGVTGGLIGNQMGAGNGRVAATAGGAAIGAIAGDRLDNPGGDYPYAAALLGSIAGGLLGAQFGSGNGQAASAAVGAVAGALIGDRVATRIHANAAAAAQATQTMQRCKSYDNYRQAVTGYTVLYRYNGREAETVLPYKPGPTIKIGIGPVDGAPVQR